jgi:hypothetical protein
VDSSASGSAKPPRRKPRVQARVVVCIVPRFPRGDGWIKRHRMYVQLTCGHQQGHVKNRRYLVGELVECRECTAAAAAAQTGLPLTVNG